MKLLGKVVTVDGLLMTICWGGLLGWMLNIVLHQAATALTIAQSVGQ